MSVNRSANNSSFDINKNKYTNGNHMPKKSETRNYRQGRNEMENINETVDIINKIQIYSRKYDKSNINFPEIVVIGSQSTGKSSILERIISVDILPKDKETCTKCPIILQLSKSNQDEISAEFLSEKNLRLNGEQNIREKIQNITNNLQNFSKVPIIIELSKKDFPKLTLVDLPGLIKNISTGNEKYIKDIEDLAEERAKSPNAIILAVSSANVDLANSDSIKLSRKFDPHGTRTFHIITKIDLMDKGTDARDILKNDLLSKSLGVILLKNRSQQSLINKEAISSVHLSEQVFLEKKYPEISSQHGIDVLVSKLVNILHNKIRSVLPSIRKDLQDTKEKLESDIKRFENLDNEMSTLSPLINNFKKIYKRIIYGDKDDYGEKLSGGALISVEIYDKFEKSVNDLIIDKINNESLKTLMRNKAGIKKQSYSIEKAYAYLSKKEINKFLPLIDGSLHTIKLLLETFVEEVIREMDINRFYNLNFWFNRKMQDFINIQFENTNKVIKSLIDCEINNVTCAYPINKLLPLANNSSEQSNSNLSITNNIIPMAAAMIPLPPYVKLGLSIAKRFGSVGCSAINILNILFERLNSAKIKEIVLVLIVAIPILIFATRNIFVFLIILLGTVISIIGIFKWNLGSGKDSDKNELKKNEKEFKDFIDKSEGIDKIYETWEAEMKKKDDPNEKLLIEMVSNNFKALKENLICNFPKWIQKFMIKDLLETMNTIEYFKEDASHLLKLDEKHENNLLILSNELKEIEFIESDLNKCIKSLYTVSE